ncbi:MAG: hypothetical protein DRI65_15475, partial [Chloroflexota bacterium]
MIDGPVSAWYGGGVFSGDASTIVVVQGVGCFVPRFELGNVSLPPRFVRSRGCTISKERSKDRIDEFGLKANPPGPEKERAGTGEASPKASVIWIDADRASMSRDGSERPLFGALGGGVIEMKFKPLMDRVAIRRLPRGRPGGLGFERRSAAWGIALGVLLAAGVAQSAQVVEMRVGRHPDFTRVVFELDSPAGYSLERNASEAGVSELVVTLSAGAETEKVAIKKGLIEEVNLVGGNHSATAHIRLSSKGLRVKEMILANPPRIVLDVMAPKVAKAAPVPAPAARPVTKAEAKAEAKAETKVEAIVETTPVPEPKTASAPPTPPTPSTPPATPPTTQKPRVVSMSLTASPEPESAAPIAVARTTPETTPAKAPTIPAAVTTASKPPESPVRAVDGARVKPSAFEQAAAPKPDSNDSAAPIAATASRSQTATGSARAKTPPPPARTRPAARPTRPASKPAAMPEPSGGESVDMKLVAAGVGLLVLVGAGLFVMKRRRAGAAGLDEIDDDPFADDNPFAQLGDDVMEGGPASSVSADEMPIFGQAAGGTAGVVNDDDASVAKSAAPGGAQNDPFDTAVVGDMDGATTQTNTEQGGFDPSAAAGDDMEGFNETTNVTQGMDSVAPMAGMDMGGE